MEPLTEEQSKLVTDNTRLVYYIIRKNFYNLKDAKGFVSEGFIGLVKAARTFNPNYITKSGQPLVFTTYASRCITNQILMALRVNKKHWKNSICMSAIESPRLSPCSSNYGGDSECGGPADEWLLTENNEANMEEDLTKYDDINLALKKAVLTDRERQVIQLIIFENKTQHECAKIMGISRSYISRIYNSALNQIKWNYDGKPLEKKNNHVTKETLGKSKTPLKRLPSDLCKTKDCKPVPQGRKLLSDEELKSRGLQRMRRADGKIWYRKIPKWELAGLTERPKCQTPVYKRKEFDPTDITKRPSRYTTEEQRIEWFKNKYGENWECHYANARKSRTTYQRRKGPRTGATFGGQGRPRQSAIDGTVLRMPKGWFRRHRMTNSNKIYYARVRKAEAIELEREWLHKQAKQEVNLYGNDTYNPTKGY